MRNILGGSDEAPTVAGTSNQNQGHGFLWRERTRDSLDLERERRSANSGGGGAPSSPPRSPGFRRRALGDFFRGFGHGGRLISIFDEEYGAFFGRDAVALDSRNYLVSFPLLSYSGATTDHVFLIGGRRIRCILRRTAPASSSNRRRQTERSEPRSHFSTQNFPLLEMALHRTYCNDYSGEAGREYERNHDWRRRETRVREEEHREGSSVCDMSLRELLFSCLSSATIRR